MPNEQSMVKSILEITLPEERAQAGWPDVARFLRSYWLVIFCCFVFTAGSAYAILSFMSELYQTEAMLLVKVGRENLDPPAVSKNVPLMAGLRHEEVMSEIEILKSPDLVGQVVDQIGLAAFRPHPATPATFLGMVKASLKSVARALRNQYHEVLYALDLRKRLSERENAIAGIVEGLVVEPVKESDVISIKLKSPDPALAENIERRLIQAFLVRRIAVRSTPGVPEFLDQVAGERKMELEKAEASKEAWRRKTGIISTPDQKSLYLKQIRELSTAHMTTLGEIEGLNLQLGASRTILAATPQYERSIEQRTPNPAMQSIEEKLIALQVQRTQALSKYLPQSQVIVEMDTEIGSLRELLAKEQATQVGSVTSQLNPNHQALQQQQHRDQIRLEGLRATARQQSADLAILEKQIADLDYADATLTGIERSRSIAEQDYLTVVRRKFDSDVATQLDRERVSNLSISMFPVSTFEPVYPRKMLLMGVALAAGLLFGIGLSLLLNYLDDRVRDSQQVEALAQIPCLATVRGSEIPA